MSLPPIRLFPLPPLFAGLQYHLDFEVVLAAEEKIDYIEVKLSGRQGWTVGSGKSSVSHHVRYPDLVARVFGRGVLPAGTHRFSVPFSLPPDMPPTHARGAASASFEVDIRVVIPWWFDLKESYVLQVRRPPPPVVVRTPFAMRSTPASAAVDKPRIEISLASSRLIAGETMTGTIAIYHMDDRNPREVELSLYPALDLYSERRHYERDDVAGVAATIILPAGTAGSGVPFALALPPNLTPSFRAATHQLQWQLYARSGSFFRGKVEITLPIEIVDHAAMATTAPLSHAPRLGDQRVAAVFSTFAYGRGWTSTDDHSTRVAIDRQLANATLRLGYAYRDDGTFLVARVSYHTLGLGLSVTRSSSVRHVFWKDIEVDIDAWDQAHLVQARYEAQATPPLKAAVPQLMRLHALGTMTQWHDSAIVWERPVQNVEAADLEAAEAALVAAAAIIEAGRFAITPPPGLDVDLPAWHALARKLDGDLAVGDLSIDGQLGHVPVVLGLAFDEDRRPTGVVVTAGNPNDASAHARAVKLQLSRPASDVLGANVAEGLVDPLTRWPADFVDLAVADGVAQAKWRFAPDAPIAASRVEELVQAVAAVLSAIEPGAGPYR